MKDLEQQNETQAETIKSLWVKIAKLEKQNEHAQAYIPKIKAERDELRAQLTPEAKAQWIMGIMGNE